MPLTSCVTTQVTEKIIVPELVFPVFPKLDGCERKDGEVIVSEDWIVRLAEYSILIQETENNYNQIKQLYCGGEE